MKVKKILSVCMTMTIIGGAAAISAQSVQFCLKAATAAEYTEKNTVTDVNSARPFTRIGIVNAQPVFALGDTNGDGAIDAVDASNVLSLYSKLSTTSQAPTEFELNTYDVNADGSIDSTDASLLLAYYSRVSTN